MKPADIKKTLDEVIDLLAHDPYPCLSHPDKDFTRKRKLCFKTIIEMIMGMGGGSLSKEIFEWFCHNAPDNIWKIRSQFPINSKGKASVFPSMHITPRLLSFLRHRSRPIFPQ